MSARSNVLLTSVHLDRLAQAADDDHDLFTRPDGRPEYAQRRVLVVLAQGAAQHWLDGRTGVKDLDVWTFYATVPGARFPADKRKRAVDFGPSELGRQAYDLPAAGSAAMTARWRT